MKLNNKTLDDWLVKPPVSCFKHRKKIDYHSNYKTLKKYLDKHVHKHVVLGSNLNDPTILLNNHGAEHIATVIEKASELLATNNQCELNALEVYILLVCIQFHDVGNIFGRYKHEFNAINIIEEAEKITGFDRTETRLIWDIVKSHGGKTPCGDKDTIGS